MPHGDARDARGWAGLRRCLSGRAGGRAGVQAWCHAASGRGVLKLLKTVPLRYRWAAPPSLRCATAPSMGQIWPLCVFLSNHRG